MIDEKLRSEIDILLRIMETGRSDILQAHDKLQVAISGSLRLLSNEATTLTSLKGSPDSIKEYILSLLKSFRQMIEEHYNQLLDHTQQVLETLEENNRKY
jgi:Mg2+ and Co2+ transporter CorA